MKPLALLMLILAALVTGGLSGCDQPREGDEPGGLPRETGPMSVPPMPGDPRPPSESTAPPDSPPAPQPPSGTPPLPVGKVDDPSRRALQARVPAWTSAAASAAREDTAGAGS